MIGGSSPSLRRRAAGAGRAGAGVERLHRLQRPRRHPRRPGARSRRRSGFCATVIFFRRNAMYFQEKVRTTTDIRDFPLHRPQHHVSQLEAVARTAAARPPPGPPGFRAQDAGSGAADRRAAAPLTHGMPGQTSGCRRLRDRIADAYLDRFVCLRRASEKRSTISSKACQPGGARVLDLGCGAASRSGGIWRLGSPVLMRRKSASRLPVPATTCPRRFRPNSRPWRGGIDAGSFDAAGCVLFDHPRLPPSRGPAEDPMVRPGGMLVASFGAAQDWTEMASGRPCSSGGDGRDPVTSLGDAGLDRPPFPDVSNRATGHIDEDAVFPELAARPRLPAFRSADGQSSSPVRLEHLLPPPLRRMFGGEGEAAFASMPRSTKVLAT